MVKIRKIIYILIFVLLAGIVSAANVCVVVQYPDSTASSECVDVAENANGREVLEATSLDILWSPTTLYGSLLCKVNGIGDEVSGDYCEYYGDFWNFNLLDDTSYKHMPVGFDGGSICWNRDFDFSDWSLLVHYCAQDGDVLGFYYGSTGYPEMLKVNEIEFYVDNGKETGTIKLQPDSELKLKIELENLYSKQSDIEIKDILVTSTLVDIDDSDDIEEESDELDLKPERTKEAEVEFNIPLEVEEDTYDLDILIEAKDDLGIEYKIEKQYEVEVDKKPHEIMFTRLELDNTELSCNRLTNLDIELINLGTKEEDVILKITNNELGLNKKLEFTLNDDPYDKESRFSDSIPITLNDALSGSYKITVKALYNKESNEETNTLDLVINECDKEIIEEETEEIIEEEDLEPITGTVVYKTTEEEKDYTTTLIVLGELAIVVLILGIALFFVKK